MKKTREEFITENLHLFWYLKKDTLHQISDEVLVEFVLNFADLPQISEMIKIVGDHNVAKIVGKNIVKAKEKKRQNYRLSILNLFGHYFASKGLLQYS